MAKKESEEQKKQKALKISIEEGTAATFSTDLGNSIITPLATAIGSNALHIGFLSSLAGFFGPIAQIKGDRMMESKSRKKIVIKYAFLQGLMWLPIAIIGLLYWKNIISGFLPWILIILYTILAFLAGTHTPAWFSWMGDLVPAAEKGRYFAKRNVLMGIAGIVALIFGGVVLKYSKSAKILFFGFAALFIVAFIFRIVSIIYLRKQYEPKFRLEKKSYFSFWDFVKRYDNFGKFAVYQAFFNFSIMVASPFFAFYMLKSLNYESNYLIYMAVVLSSTFFYLMFTPLVGKFSDKYGNKRLLWIANILFAINPLLWLFVKTPLMIVFIPQILVGLANAALNISITNYTYDSVSRQKRGLCLAYTNIMIGSGALIGSLLGGLLINILSFSWINSFFFVFILAAVLRLAVALFFLPKLKEVRRTAKLRLHSPIHIHLNNPLRFIHFENTSLGFNHRKAKASNSDID
jgi:MFS family permease